MQIQLNQQEIEEAVKDFVVKQGFTIQGREVEVTFTAGRGSNGITADIEIQTMWGSLSLDEEYEPPYEDDEMPRRGIILHTVGGKATETLSKQQSTAKVIEETNDGLPFLFEDGIDDLD
ncbi:hypothetical protein [Advenella alkanexedens]|uniref:hypothetical protein n=1 Tax=Advenella alkanexedens TaxID=1481665 RepID=UPI0026761582|nr:hypothetical protein [Advenella alkanexedens]WKU18322.1 hypothetical protein Q3V95_08310 [Advenella alkanexedens]